MSMTLGHYRVHARKKYIYIFSLIDLLHNFGFVFTVIGPAFISSVSFLFTNYCSHKFRIHHIKFVLKVARSSLFIAVYKQLLALGHGTPDQIYYLSVRESEFSQVRYGDSRIVKFSIIFPDVAPIFSHD